MGRECKRRFFNKIKYKILLIGFVTSHQVYYWLSYRRQAYTCSLFTPPFKQVNSALLSAIDKPVNHFSYFDSNLLNIPRAVLPKFRNMRFFSRLQSKIRSREENQLSPASNPVESLVVPSSNTINEAEQLPEQKQEKTGFQPKDLWQIAYEELDNKDQQVLERIQGNTHKGHGDPVSTIGLVNKVIQLTEKRYKDYQEGGLIR